VIAIAGGLGAALSWAGSTLASSRSSRMLGATSVIAWVMVVGLAVIAVPASLAEPVALDGGQFLGLAIVGVANNAGLSHAILGPVTADRGRG
jgi:drug/metabolite transporter (DMT)-like permease